MDAELEIKAPQCKRVLSSGKMLRRSAPTFFFAASLAILWLTRGFHNSVSILLLAGFATVATAAVIAQQLPLQNVIALLSIASFTALVQLPLNKFFGFPMPRFFGIENATPLAFVLLWTTAVLNSRGTAKWILQRQRHLKNYGLWLISSGSLLVAILDANSFKSPQVFVKDFFCAAICFIACVPWFIDKRGGKSQAEIQSVLLIGLLLFLEFLLWR